MKTSSFERQRKAKLAFYVLAVGLLVSVLVGVMLVFISRIRPHY